MTYDKVLNVAGREMDALIAEYVMGIKPQQVKDFPLFSVKRDWLDIGEWYFDGNHGSTVELPFYSTDIAAAFLVWDKLVEMERYPTLHEGPQEYDGAVVAGVSLVNPATSEAFAETKALAICRAALIATMK